MPPTRRQFLAAASVAATTTLLAASPTRSRSQPKPSADSVIFLMMTGGPSQLDTFDPKPDAPSDVRSPFAPIPTKVPGIRITELFPKMAGIADKFALVRSVHHTDAPIHEVGFQWVNSGRFFGDGPEWPSVGAVVSHLNGEVKSYSDWFVIPWEPVQTGLGVSHGQGCSWLDVADRGQFSFWNPLSVEERISLAGHVMTDTLGKGVKRPFALVNQFDTVFNSPSWDCHADYAGPLSCSLSDYRDTVAPSFDAAFTQLVTDLDQRGLLERTLVVATGEFGRTPKFNCNGGRDHWPGVWTTVFAGGGVKGGQVIGSSDAIASEPNDRPVHASDISATIFHALGIGPDATIPGPSGSPVPAYTGRPVVELF
jgi:hypothetical protein